MPRTAVYPGSFDPFTNGHLDVLRAACGLCDRLIVAVGVHPSKAGFLSVANRLEVIRSVAGPFAETAGISVEARTFDGLVVDFAEAAGAAVLIRGVRDGTDLDYELQMAGMNSTMAPWLQTVFVPASPASRHITATLVRQIAMLGGDIGPFVPPAVAAIVKETLRRPTS